MLKEPPESVICDGCSEQCIQEVEYIYDEDGNKERGYVVCDRTDYIGRILVWEKD